MKDEIPGLLLKMGMQRTDGSPLEPELIEPWLGLVLELIREEPVYRFGVDGSVYARLFDAARGSLAEAADIRFPRDIVFVNRTVLGHLGNLMRLESAGPWRETLERHAGA
jgi:hypothetical protein